MKDRNELKKEVALRLRELRKQFYLTQEQMSSQFDTGRANYSRVEKGEIFPNYIVLYTLCAEMGISLNWFVAGKGPEAIGEAVKEESKGDKTQIEKTSKELESLLKEIHLSQRLFHSVMELYHRHMLEKSRSAAHIENNQNEILQ